MAKSTFLSFSTTAGDNTDIDGIGTQGTNAVSNFDNAFRTLMAILRRDLDNGTVFATKSAGYTAVAGDNNAFYEFTATATLALTAAATLAADWHMTVFANGGTVTVDPASTELINGASTLTIASGDSAYIICTGTEFKAIVIAGAGFNSVSSPQGRLTLTSGVPVTEADVAGATTVYYTPTSGSSLPMYSDVNARFAMRQFSELSLPLNSNSGHVGYHQSGKNFDLFVIDDAGTLRLATGPAWASDTARGTGAGTTELEQVGGFLVNKVSITARWGVASGNTVSIAARKATYIGSFRAVANGQASDTKRLRLLFNAYNKAIRDLYVTDTTSSHSYSTNTYRQYNGDAGNQVEILAGLAGVIARVNVLCGVNSSTATPRNVWTGVGLDSATTPATGQVNPSATAFSGFAANPSGVWSGPVGLGYHTLKWLQRGAGTDTQNWLGTAGLFDVGMVGEVAL